MEIWKDIYYIDIMTDEIIDYRNLYQVSNLGRIKSLNYRRTGKEEIRKQKRDKDGYMLIDLSNGKTRTFKVHRLVAYMFIPNNDKSKWQINHKDENVFNNCVENLEWCTPKYNDNYGNHIDKIRAGNTGKKAHESTRKKISENNKNEKNPKASIIMCITTNEIFKCIKFGAEKYNVDFTSISKCCSGKYKSAGKLNGKKLVWKYLSNCTEEEILNYIIKKLQVPIN